VVNGGAVLLALLLTACFGDERTKFPEGLEPLEESTAPAPDPTDSEEFPETLVLVDGHRDGFAFVHGHAFVHASLADTWSAMRTPQACVDARAVDRWSIIEVPLEEPYDFTYKVHNEVDDVITVEFDITWRHGAVEGTVDAPELVVANYQKTWGTTFIDILRGSVVATAVDDQTTEITFVEHLKGSADAGTMEIRSYLRDYYANILALSHGDPLPEY